MRGKSRMEEDRRARDRGDSECSTSKYRTRCSSCSCHALNDPRVSERVAFRPADGMSAEVDLEEREEEMLGLLVVLLLTFRTHSLAAASSTNSSS